MIGKLTDLQRLSLDTYKGSVAKFSREEANEAIKKALEEACGGEWNFKNFRRNKLDVYEVLEEVLSIGLGEILVDQFNGFAETHDTNLGDTYEFVVEDNSLFRVASIADGNTDIRRQKVFGKKVTVATEKLAIKVYSDLDLFMSGRIDWSKMVNRVMDSYAHEVGVRIYNAIYGSYSKLTAPYAFSGTFSEDKLAEMIAHVEAKTGQKAVVFGTKKALGKIASANISDKMKDELNVLGHYGVFQGTELMELPQAHIAGTDTFAVADDFLLIIPNGEKIVKIILEGDAYIYETAEGVRNDEQKEFFFGRKVGVGVLVANNYAMYKLS